MVLFIFEDEDEAHAFAKDETAVARNMVFLRRSHSLSRSSSSCARRVRANVKQCGVVFVFEEKFARRERASRR